MNPSATEIHEHFLELSPTVSERLAEAIRAAGPRRFPDRSDVSLGYFLSRVIVGQQLSTGAARAIWSRVEAAATECGSDIPELFREEHQDRLRACGLSRNKIRALGHVRRAHVQGELDGASLGALDHADISRRLRPLWGVGQWTCDMAALFYCRCPDVWPEQDVTVQRTFAALIGRRRKASRAAAHFAPYRSWLALYMWGIADAVPQ